MGGIMKKIKKIVYILLIITIFSIKQNVYASGLSVSSGNVYAGDTFTVSVSIYAASWNVHVNSTGPVTDCKIDAVDSSLDAMNASKTFQTTCRATQPGTITISLTGDVTTATSNSSTPLSDTKTVTVSKRPTSNVPQNTPNNNSNRGNTTIQSDPNKSSNNKLKEITIDGYKLTKIDDNNYSVIVRYDTESINISATAEDKKTKIEGTGNHKLNIGDNLIELILTAENGSQNKITILATRKDAFYIDDLDYVINNTKYDKEDITVKEDTKITLKDMKKIKKSNKTFSFNYYNQEKQLLYSWTINGKKIKKTTEFNTSVDNKSKYEKNIREISNYADGIIVHFKNDGDYPKGTRIKLFVGSKYSNNDKVNIYYFDPKTKTLKYVDKNYKVKNGYIEFDVVGDNYFISMSKISGLEDAPKNTSNPTIPILFFVFSILIFSLSVIIYFVRKKHLNKSKDIADNNNEEI